MSWLPIALQAFALLASTASIILSVQTRRMAQEVLRKQVTQ